MSTFVCHVRARAPIAWMMSRRGRFRAAIVIRRHCVQDGFEVDNGLADSLEFPEVAFGIKENLRFSHESAMTEKAIVLMEEPPGCFDVAPPA